MTMSETRRMLRYEVPDDGQSHTIPLSHSPVGVAAVVEGGDAGWRVEFWAESTEGAFPHDRTFRVFGTGDPLPPDALWVATCPRVGGLVLHLYEVNR